MRIISGIRKSHLIAMSSILFVLIVSLCIILIGQNQNSVKEQSTEKLFITPTNPAWLYTNGNWKQVNVPGWGDVMKGWLEGRNGEQFGRRAKIETDSSFVILKQRSIIGDVTVFVDGEIVINQKMKLSDEINEIPIYSDNTGWHEIEIVHSARSEIDGLYISADAKTRKPINNKKKLVVIGHSYVEGCCASNIGLNSFSALMGDMLGVESINQGTGGTDINVSDRSKKSTLERVQSDVIDLKPEYVLSVHGFNAMVPVMIGHFTHEQYEQDYTKFLKEINDALPSTKIFASGIISVPSWTEEELLPFNKDIENACANASNCTYINLSNKWNEDNYSKYLSNDKVHPNDEGHKYLAEEYSSVISSVLNK